MQVKLEQVFYGRGQFGYGVLGASPNGKAFSDAVESLCESIGSPDAFLTWEPFLVNRRFGDYCLMCRVQPGEPDSCGRPTILYHVLIGLTSEMVAAGLDAETNRRVCDAGGGGRNVERLRQGGRRTTVS